MPDRLEHIPPDRLEQVARAEKNTLPPFTQQEWEHFRHCEMCLERFREFIRIAIRSKQAPETKE